MKAQRLQAAFARRREADFERNEKTQAFNKYFDHWNKVTSRFEAWTDPEYYQNAEELVRKEKEKKMKEQKLEERRARLKQLLDAEEAEYDRQLKELDKPKPRKLPNDFLEHLNRDQEFLAEEKRRIELESKLYGKWRYGINDENILFESKTDNQTLAKLNWLDKQKIVQKKEEAKKAEERQLKLLLETGKREESFKEQQKIRDVELRELRVMQDSSLSELKSLELQSDHLRETESELRTDIEKIENEMKGLSARKSHKPIMEVPHDINWVKTFIMQQSEQVRQDLSEDINVLNRILVDYHMDDVELLRNTFEAFYERETEKKSKIEGMFESEALDELIKCQEEWKRLFKHREAQISLVLRKIEEKLETEFHQNNLDEQNRLVEIRQILLTSIQNSNEKLKANAEEQESCIQGDVLPEQCSSYSLTSRPKIENRMQKKEESKKAEERPLKLLVGTREREEGLKEQQQIREVELRGMRAMQDSNLSELKSLELQSNHLRETESELRTDIEKIENEMKGLSARKSHKPSMEVPHDINWVKTFIMRQSEQVRQDLSQDINVLNRILVDYHMDDVELLRNTFEAFYERETEKKSKIEGMFESEALDELIKCQEEWKRLFKHREAQISLVLRKIEEKLETEFHQNNLDEQKRLAEIRQILLTSIQNSKKKLNANTKEQESCIHADVLPDQCCSYSLTSRPKIENRMQKEEEAKKAEERQLKLLEETRKREENLKEQHKIREAELKELRGMQDSNLSELKSRELQSNRLRETESGLRTKIEKIQNEMKELSVRKNNKPIMEIPHNIKRIKMFIRTQSEQIRQDLKEDINVLNRTFNDHHSDDVELLRNTFEAFYEREIKKQSTIEAMYESEAKNELIKCQDEWKRLIEDCEAQISLVLRKTKKKLETELNQNLDEQKRLVEIRQMLLTSIENSNEKLKAITKEQESFIQANDLADQCSSKIDQKNISSANNSDNDDSLCRPLFGRKKVAWT